MTNLVDLLSTNDALAARDGLGTRVVKVAEGMRVVAYEGVPPNDEALTVALIMALEALAAANEATAQLRREFEALKSQIVRKDR